MKEGENVERLFGNQVLMTLKITKISDYIYCGPWKFHKETLKEVDEELEWDGIDKYGTFIRKIK